jgi:branched-subunit amino acid ABC-type transport system permease component
VGHGANLGRVVDSRRGRGYSSLGSVHVLLLSIGFGLVTASLLSLSAVGISLQFGVTNLINFAYGEFLTLGAYFAWVLNSHFALDIWPSMIVGAIMVGLVAVLLNRFLFRPFVKKGIERRYLLIVTFGLSLILSNVVLAVWGADYRRFNVPTNESTIVGPFRFTSTQAVIIVMAVGAMLAVHLLLSRTKLGKAMRAMSDNSELALVTGINTDRVATAAWLVSGFLAGLGGVALALNVTAFSPSFGNDFLFVIFAAMILGGVGSPYGAMLGAIVIGLTTEVSAVFINSVFKGDVAFALMIAILLLRPQGLTRIFSRD